MNSLKIPEGGVMLKGSPGEDSDPLPQQAFTLSLSDSVIEGMIQCVQDGGDIQLALGAQPTFHYGSKSHRISSPSDDHLHDLYLTQPYNSLREGVQIPNMPLFRNPKLNRLPSKASRPVVNAPPHKTKSSDNASSASSFDSDVEALRNGLAAEKAKHESTVLLSGPLPTNKKAASKMKSKLLKGANTANVRSLSTSPALKPVASPSPDPLADPAKRAKIQRAPLVHELAIHEQTTEHLREKWEGKPEEFKPVLEKVADYSSDLKTWAMRKAYWRELDVWNYDYDSDDREQAIKNAIKQYDKNRLSASEPEWERLNRKEDRGKGICLSKLQKNLAKGPAAPAPKIKVQKADDSSTSTSTSKDRDDGDVGLSDKPRVGGEGMSRSASNPLPKSKKISGSEAQAKRLLNPKPKAASQKPSPTKGKPAPPSKGQTNGRRGALSQEFIENSDSDDDETAPLSKTTTAKPKPAAKPIEKPKRLPEKPAERTMSKPKPVARDPLPKPVAKPAAKPTAKPAPKRRLDDEDSSSSSGTPLSQRMKLKQPLPSQPPAKKRALEPRQAPREAAPSSLNKNKNTSPTKSSPLASSPPTNASDITDDDRISKKRKADMDQKAPPAKRQAADEGVPAEVLSQAQKFKTYYTKYEALHYEISGLDNPPKDKLADLRDMRDRLAQMKAQIYKKYKG